jgi:hypothetical protein
MKKWKKRYSRKSQKLNCLNKLVKGLDDRLVISVNIKVKGYLQYSLDAQVDTGAMNSCAKHGALPEYYWQPVDISFRAVNKTELKIKLHSSRFSILYTGRKSTSNSIQF